jgi:hypothetical protein
MNIINKTVPKANKVIGFKSILENEEGVVEYVALKTIVVKADAYKSIPT